MGVLSKEELLNKIKTAIGDKTDDETISLLEDVDDTIKDFEDKTAGDGTDWKAKYEENDKAWRDKYKARFFAPTNKEDDNEQEHDDGENDSPKTFDDLFTEK